MDKFKRLTRVADSFQVDDARNPKEGPKFSIKEVTQDYDGGTIHQYCIVENATGDIWEDTDRYYDAVELVNRYNNAKSDPKNIQEFMSEVHPSPY